MKNKDQILLENLYNNILSEAESTISSYEEESDVDVNKIVHDIFNKITPYLFDFSGEEFKLKFKDVIKKIIEGLNERIQKI
jgi:hypothetical protein